MDQKEAYQEKANARLAQLDAEIDRLKALADLKGADARVEYYRQIENLESKRADVKDKLYDVMESSKDAWQSIKNGLDHAMKDLKDAVSDASQKFKS